MGFPGADVRSADHDLGRHAADIDASATNGAALDQRDPGALIDGLQGRRHRGPAAADHGDMQCTAITAQPLAHLAKPTASDRSWWGIGECRTIAERGHGGG